MHTKSQAFCCASRPRGQAVTLVESDIVIKCLPSLYFGMASVRCWISNGLSQVASYYRHLHKVFSPPSGV